MARSAIPPPKPRRTSRPPRAPVTYAAVMQAIDESPRAVKPWLLELVMAIRPLLEARDDDGRKRLVELIRASASLDSNDHELLVDLAYRLGVTGRSRPSDIGRLAELAVRLRDGVA